MVNNESWTWDDSLSPDNQNPKSDKTKKRSGKKKIKFKEFISMIKQLASMIDSGLQTVEALEILEETGGVSGKAAREWKQGVMVGKTLSMSISEGSVKIPKEFITIIESGEESGKTVESMNIYVRELERQDKIERKKRSALIYPSIVLGMVGIILAVMFGLAVPKLENAFVQSGVVPTGISAFVFNCGHVVEKVGFINSLVVSIIFAIFMIFTPYGRSFIILCFSVVPAVRKLKFSSEWSIFFSMLGTGVSSGISMPKALILSTPLAPKQIKKDYDRLVEAIYQGKDITDPEIIKWPPVVKGFLKSGLKAGGISDSMLSIGAYYGKEAEEFAESLSKALEPAILLVLVGTIGLVPIAMVKVIAQMYMSMLQGL